MHSKIKQLLLIRHAKAEQILIGKDFARQLTERGHEDCKTMCERLKKLEFTADSILTSSAARTIQTAENFAKKMHWNHKILQAVPEFYNADHSVLFNAIAKSDDKLSSLVIVAHNPGISILYNLLTREDNFDLPTCGMALFFLDSIHWEDINLKKCRLDYVSWPKKEEQK